MIVLTSTTDNLQAVLAGSVTTNQPQCVTSWRDITTTDFTPGRTVINTNNTTDVNIVAAPAASTQRVVDLINIYNKDTVAATVTVKFDANGTQYILWKGTLAAGESVQYVEGHGWKVLSTDGVPKTESGSGSGLSAGDIPLYTDALLSTTVVETDNGLKQALYTVPTGKQAIITKIIAKESSVDFTGHLGILNFGFDGGAADLGTTFTSLGVLTDNTKYILLSNDVLLSGYPSVIGDAADVFGCLFTDTSLTGGLLTIDTFGYLY